MMKRGISSCSNGDWVKELSEIEIPDYSSIE